MDSNHLSAVQSRVSYRLDDPSMAPKAGLEPATFALTARCTTIVLLGYGLDGRNRTCSSPVPKTGAIPLSHIQIRKKPLRKSAGAFGLNYQCLIFALITPSVAADTWLILRILAY